jgi:hypothetical protein
MDMKLLPHLSERALREEADKRGLRTDGLDREQLILAIRGHEGQLTTLPPGGLDTMAFAQTLPPAGQKKSPLDRARGLLDRVVKARSKTEPDPERDVECDPIRTRSMARLLEGQGHLDRAYAIVRELSERARGDEELARWRASLEARLDERIIREQAESRLARGGVFVELTRAEHSRGIVWRVEEAGIARARALLGTEGALTLRVVRVRAHADHSVESRQEDRRPLETSGWARIEADKNARLIVSVGLCAGERFASIAHAAG